jgi:hypothetical protein
MQKIIPGFSEKYSIHIDGNVIRNSNGRRLKAGCSWGYWAVTLCDMPILKRKQVHILLATAFIPNPENKTQINHKNGIKLDNRIENLEWCTPSENIQHAFDTGLKTPVAPMSKINFEIAEEIRRRFKAGEKTMTELGSIYGIHQSNVSRLINKNHWKCPDKNR